MPISILAIVARIGQALNSVQALTTWTLSKQVADRFMWDMLMGEGGFGIEAEEDMKRMQ
jgi:hypothetical protein